MPQDAGPQPAPDQPAAEPVWSYRGYRLHAGEFTTAMIHLFRAEISRSNTWRQRIDTTTNWAVLTTGAAISFAFTNSLEYHGVILLNALLITVFLYIEARRYRYYELWSLRVRLLETDFFAAMMVPPFRPAPDWGETMADALLHPRFPVSRWEAFGRRLRHNYAFLYLILELTWIAKLALYPVGAPSLAEFIRRAHIGAAPGGIVLAFDLIAMLLLLGIALVTQSAELATLEKLPRLRRPVAADEAETATASKPAIDRQGWSRPSGRQFLAYIFTQQPAAVAERITRDTGRPVTPLSEAPVDGGQAVLLCVPLGTEIPQLKALVRELDPQGSVVVTAAQPLEGEGAARH